MDQRVQTNAVGIIRLRRVAMPAIALAVGALRYFASAVSTEE